MTATRVTVPMLDLAAQYAPIRDEIREVVEEVFDSCRFIGGPHVVGLESELSSYVGAAHGVGVSSGTDALLVAFMALGIGPGDEVVTTPYTFFATVGCIARLGAIPRFVDIDPVTYNIDPNAIEAAITDKTKAIVPVHLFGQCAEMGPINAIAKKHGLPVVEDAAQAIGAKDADGRMAGNLGDIACFSFYPSKNLGAAGDGGMITTSDADLSHTMAIMRNHGMEPAYHHEILGGNFRLDAIQAAVLRIKLRRLDDWAAARRANAADYRRRFDDSGLDGIVRLPFERPGVHHIYNQFVVRIPDGKRDSLREHLKTAGIGCDVYYPKPAHMQPCFADLGYKTGEFPESEQAALQTIALPIFGELTDEQKEAVVDAVAEHIRS
jgi:dTDP-4-amino-4,6-dideoxygalactose transaminase